ncbi:MAG: DDE-type integrase/transposase/recombinase [Myxococcales bacterium FL481]|nr:MAG: DDE-type integrase/transposase/recombinase [Myxococcales bacterium FL481]
MTNTSTEAKPSGQRRTYSERERRRILKDLDKDGLKETARKHGVPKSTICNWKRKAREKAAATKRASAPHTPAKVPKTTAKQSDKPAKSPAQRPPRRTARRYTPSERARAIEHAAVHGVSATAKELGISRYSIYEWRRQLERANRGEGPSPTSGPDPADIEAQRDREILGEWKKHPGLGPSQIRNQLRRRGIKVGVATVRRVMTDAGYRPPKIRRDPHDKRYEAVRPNGLWHLDFVHRYINKASTFTLILIDDHSRFVVGHGVDDAERSKMVLRTFEDAVQRHGKPETVMHDKGAAFWSWRGSSKFTALLTELGIDQIVAEKKEHNGKVEVFNGNLAKEFFNQHRFYDLSEMRRRLAGHLRWYNHGRTHHALGGLLVPADRYFGRADEVLARIEAGALREGDELGLSERGLELFKVVSKGGVPELWLCGQRLGWPTKK